MEQLHGCLERVSAIINEDARSPAPHLCLHFAAKTSIYAMVGRAATVSRHEPIILSTVSIFAALVDSEEEDFLTKMSFAKSLMRLATKVVDQDLCSISAETETAILELLFTVAAKIRLEPGILSFWFRTSAKPGSAEDIVQEKTSFVGLTQRNDFPLCYMLIDRVHREGRVGDFARTGLLYIFEATGRSPDLEEWVVASDLPTLLASGLGALYSQLSRELSLLHSDATLPAVLAMSDYNTAHLQPTAELAYSERHQNHMRTFLSNLAFWQDVLDHCRSADVKQTLLDHFQILFLQQLLYPSLLQSSDADAGSAVAVLTYLTAMFESLEYPDLMSMILRYLLAIPRTSTNVDKASVSPAQPPPSVMTLRRREDLMQDTAPEDSNDVVEPALFSLVDLTLHNIDSSNEQSIFGALGLASTILVKQKTFAFGTLLRVEDVKQSKFERTVGALASEVELLAGLGASVHEHAGLERAFAGLVEDAQVAIEMQLQLEPPELQRPQKDHKRLTRSYILSPTDPLLQALTMLLQNFFTNSVHVNLALTQAIISIALCLEIRLDGWLAMTSNSDDYVDSLDSRQRPWQKHLDDQERQKTAALHNAARRPVRSDDNSPLVLAIIKDLATELDTVRSTTPTLDMLISHRKRMLEAANLDTPPESSHPPRMSSLKAGTSSNIRQRRSSRSRRANTQQRTGSPSPRRPKELPSSSDSPQEVDKAPSRKSIFQPPPPDTAFTTDILLRQITFPEVVRRGHPKVGRNKEDRPRQASLNHVLTNIVMLQEFILELVAVMQVRAAVLGEEEVKII